MSARGGRLGRIQRYVLLVLAGRGQAAASDWDAWHPFTCDQARTAIYGLEGKGLVDRVGFKGTARIYGLTERGRALARAYSDEPLAAAHSTGEPGEEG